MKRKSVLSLFLMLLLSCVAGTASAQPGITWTARSSAADNFWNSVVYGNGLFVAVSSTGTGNRVMTSPDGITWTSRNAAADNAWRGLAFGNGLFVAVAASGTGNRIMTSADGISWTIRSSPADNDWLSVAYGNGMFVAVAISGSGNRAMRSFDGINWTLGSTPVDNQWGAVTYGNGLFVAVAAASGTTNRVMTSAEGLNWTIGTTPNNNDWTAVTYGNGMFVAVAAGPSASKVMTSTDGFSWTLQTAAAGAAQAWFGITYGEGLYVAVAYTGRVMTSPDGINWTLRTTPVNNEWLSVTCSNSIFVAVSQSGTGNRVMTSGTFTLPLPVKWISLNGNITTAEKAEISWRVAEQNVSGYEVEKSKDGVNFSIAGYLPCTGNGDHSYSFTDPQPLNNTVYYRVKQKDVSGRFAYSNIITLHSDGMGHTSVYPNPVNEMVTVTTGKKNKNATALLLDIEGKVLQHIKINSQSFLINLTGYPDGVYFLKPGNEPSIKIVKTSQL